MWFGHLFKVFRSVSCKLRFYRLCIAIAHVKLVNLFVEKQVMLLARVPDTESEICML